MTKKKLTEVAAASSHDRFRLQSLEKILSIFDGGAFMDEVLIGHRQLQMDPLDHKEEHGTKGCQGSMTITVNYALGKSGDVGMGAAVAFKAPKKPPASAGAVMDIMEDIMNCPYCLPADFNPMEFSSASTPELENGSSATCPACGFSIIGLNTGVVSVAILTLQRHLADMFPPAHTRNPDHVKWGVQILGSDECFPHETHAAAVENANALNALNYRDTEEDILCFAYPAPWPGDDADHAHWMAKGNKL